MAELLHLVKLNKLIHATLVHVEVMAGLIVPATRVAVPTKGEPSLLEHNSTAMSAILALVYRAGSPAQTILNPAIVITMEILSQSAKDSINPMAVPYAVAARMVRSPAMEALANHLFSPNVLTWEWNMMLAELGNMNATRAGANKVVEIPL